MELVKIVCKALEDVKAMDIQVLDMRGISPIFDYMVIASASNNRQASALVRNVADECSKNGYGCRGIEGADGSWILVDLKDIIVNVFLAEEREHYALEKLYLDVNRLDVEELLK